LIQTAGGLTDKAGKTVAVTHRDEPTRPITLTLSNDPVRMAENNIELLPGDSIVVSKAGIVYIVGEVNRPGGFVMENNRITASQLLVLAAGPTSGAALNKAEMIRHTPEGLKDIPLPLKKLLEAKIPDVELQPEDILWVPNRWTKGLGASSTSILLSTLATAAIYRF